MPIFKTTGSKLSLINEINIELEKDIQTLTENNLEEIFNLNFIKSEFSLNNFRIDTLAFNTELKSFIIIEYKRDKSFSVVDQGYSYLSLMLNNKADFILEYNERMNNNLKRTDVDWSQSKVIFIANSFTNYQKQAINFNDLPIELWEVKLYANDTVLFNQLKSSSNSESIKTISGQNKTIQKVSNEIKTYSVQDHLKGSQFSKDLYEDLREKVLSLDSRIEENSTKTYISYKIGNKNFIDITIQKNKIRLHLYRVKPKDLKDPENRVSYVDNSMEYYNKYVSKFFIENNEDVDYGLFLAKQVYKKTFS